jgi:exosome complex component RRP41
MPRSQIDIFVQVLQADGGVKACCINAASMALADAAIPMQDLITSCAAGYLNVTPILDLNYTEESGGGPDLTVALFPKLDKISLLQMDSKLPMDVCEKVMNLASEGAKTVAEFIREKLMDNTRQLVYARGPLKL